VHEKTEVPEPPAVAGAGDALSRRHFLGLAGAGVGAAGMALASCGSSKKKAGKLKLGDSTPATTAPLAGRTVSVAVYSKNHASAPLYWQRFAPPGLKVEVKIFTSGGDMNRALEAGTLDFGLFGVYNGLIDKENGLGSKIICMVARGGIGLIARADRNINSVADLKGKSIAVPPPGGQVLILTTLLDRAGLKLDKDVKAVPLGYADHVAALQRGDVDAYIGTEPPASLSVVSGVGKRLADVTTTALGDFNSAIWASPKMLLEADLLTAAAKMQRDAAEYLSPGGQNDTAVWHDLLVTQFGYTEAVFTEVLPHIGAVWKFDDVRKGQFEAAGTVMRATGVLKKDPDYSTVYALQYQPAS